MGASGLPIFRRLPLNGNSFVCEGDPGEPILGSPRVSITEEEGKILSGIAAGRFVVEIGTGLGVSTCALARYANVVWTHDIDEWVHRTIWPTLPENAVPSAERPDPRYTYSVDLVFIDANHETDAVLADIAYAREFSPALIILHDAKYQTVQRAMLIDEGDWTTLDTFHGLALGR